MNVEVTPWKRFGHDRLYITVDDHKVGYRDLTTGEDHPRIRTMRRCSPRLSTHI